MEWEATGRDPRDRNIRLAPSFPELSEVETAIERHQLSNALGGNRFVDLVVIAAEDVLEVHVPSQRSVARSQKG